MIKRFCKYGPDVQALLKPFLVAANQTCLTIKAYTNIMVKDVVGALDIYRVVSFDADTTFAVADYLDTGVIEAGKDYFVYILNFIPAGKSLPILVSLNSTYPGGGFGATANNSRKVGGFHTLCCAVGTIAGHPLTGFATGAVLPASVWCLNWRSAGLQEGMTYNALTRKWRFIYGASGTGVNTRSAYGAMLTASRNQMDFNDDMAAVGCRLPSDDEFTSHAWGSNAQTNVYGSLETVTAGKCAPKLFTGAGLNDLAVDRSAYLPPGTSPNEAQEYEIEIDATGAPDTVKWRQRNPASGWGGYTTGIPIAAPISLNGAVFTFAASTGHTLGNKWNVYIMNGLVDTANCRMIAHDGGEHDCGAMSWWLSTTSYQFAGAVGHTHQVVVSGDPETVTSGPSVDGAPVWGWYSLPGGKGYFYKQGSFGDVKLVAGGRWSHGTSCGPRCRAADNYRWAAYAAIGARGCAEPM